ncbi:MAG: NfeD family protein [Acidimicrobiales bacterium]
MRQRTQLSLVRTILGALLVTSTVAIMFGSAAIAGFGLSPASAQSGTESGTDAEGGGEDGSTGSQSGGDSLAECPADRDQVPAANSQVRIVKVAGLIDPVVKRYLLDELDKAEGQSSPAEGQSSTAEGQSGTAETEVLAMILWVNSHGSVLDNAEYLELATRLHESPLQIALWVGQTGSTARGGAAELAVVADLVGVTPNSTIGETGPRRLPEEWGNPFGEFADELETELFTADQAVQAGISAGPLQNIVNVGSFATELDGFEVFRCTNEDGLLETIPQTRAQISGLSLTSQLFHTVASPEVAYLFFVMGLALLVFELFTAGVGVAGVLGAVFLVLGSYGLAELPTRWWAIALLLVAMVLLAVDIQTNVPRLYTILGLVSFVLGTWLLYDGVSMSRVTAAAGIIGALLYAYTGMPSMVRTRFSTPTIGRKWMIGELGEAMTDVDPEGTVKIRDVAWRAITNRATPVEKGGPVRVIGINRLVLEIEPEEGGARDYRERS